MWSFRLRGFRSPKAGNASGPPRAAGTVDGQSSPFSAMNLDTRFAISRLLRSQRNVGVPLDAGLR